MILYYYSNNFETKDFFMSSYTNREINKSNTFLLVFCSLSLEGTKGTEVTQLDYQHLWDLFVLQVVLFCSVRQRNCDEAHLFEIDTIQLDTVNLFAR